jgi:V/A-type H+-transporting ATPase subunit E
MPIWEEVELFCRAVSEAGHKKAEKILKHAKANADRIVAEARRVAEKEFQEQTLAQRSKAYGEAKRLVDAAELEARKRIITFREQVIREVFSALEQRLKSIRNNPEYADFLLSAIKEGIDALSGKEFVVELKKEDVEISKEKVEALGKKLFSKIDLRASTSMENGARIYTGDGRLLYDNSLSARLKRHEDEIRTEIWRKIFGEDKRES